MRYLLVMLFVVTSQLHYNPRPIIVPTQERKAVKQYKPAPTLTSKWQSTSSGYGAYYSKGVMERVARNRGLPVQGCMVASLGSDIGDWITIEHRGVRRSCFVMDVVASQDQARMRQRRIVVEVDWNTAVELFGVTVKRPLRPSDIPVTVYW